MKHRETKRKLETETEEHKLTGRVETRRSKKKRER